MQLSRSVLDLLAPALNGHNHLGGLLLRNNRLPRHGVQFVSTFIEMNKSIKCLASCNKIENVTDATCIAQAVLRHPNIESLILHQAGLGICSIMTSIMPALYNPSLEAVSLGHNGLAAIATEVLSSFLSKNPTLKTLHLDKNLLTDEDVGVIARSLLTNTNLEEINLHHNKFGTIGSNLLLEAVCNMSSLNAIHASNHTCHLKFDTTLVELETGRTLTEYESKLFFNTDETESPETRRKAKIIHALSLRTNPRNIDFSQLSDIPINLMPHVLHFFQNENKSSSLTRVFQVMSEWNMPWLFTNDHKKCRFKRRRSKSSNNFAAPVRRSARIQKIRTSN